MFQSFESSTTPDQGPPRLAALRAEMANEGLDGFIVPRADVHQGEYVAPRDARLEWLTGFTGSAGFCAALKDRAGVFIDGRYRLQVRDQVADCFEPVHWPEVQLQDWLREALPDGGVIGFDPWLHTVDEIKRLKKALDGSGISLRSADNLVDRIWPDQPEPPSAPFSVYPEALAGETHSSKRQRITADNEAGCNILTLPDSIAWLLNIRGTDIERNPVPHGFATLAANGAVTLYAQPSKVSDQVSAHLGQDVIVRDIAHFEADIPGLPAPVRIDPKWCPDAILSAAKASGIAYEFAPDPCVLPKARKNDAEVAGAKAAHIRDGTAMVRFLAWIDTESPNGTLTEIDVIKALEGFRRDTNQLRDISFETICGAGPNGAIVHYRVTEDTNAALEQNNLLLVDSGGQYHDGTTDITRTIAIGSPSDEHRRCYTRVLQGMIAISRARFPKGVGGQHLDALARYPLWLDGKDYDHGTGHGVGAYLSVHEGPQGLSRRSPVPLEPGMILSNEPGYYREGDFGIRIENLIVTIPAPALAGADDRDMLSFETLTWVPFDRRLIDVALLTTEERGWIDQYHADTLTLLAPTLDGSARDWLTAACAPL